MNTATGTHPALDEVNDQVAENHPSLARRGNEWGGYDYGKRTNGDPIVRTAADDTVLTVYSFHPRSGCNGSVRFDGGATTAYLIGGIVDAYLANA